MELLMRRCFLLLGLFFLAGKICAETTYLSGMRIKANPDASYFTFILNKKAFGVVKFLPKSTELIIEFENTLLSGFILKNVKLQSSNVSVITSNKMPNNKLQFIFKLKQNVQWKVHYLPTEGNVVKLQLDVFSVTVSQDAHPPSQNLRNIFNADVLKTYDKLSLDLARQETLKRKFIIVIDAGHGGIDPGAIGLQGTQEKKITLMIAKLLAQKINRSPHMHAVLTRDDDSYLTLRKRLQLARNAQADLFIAIHADAYFNNSVEGASVFALSKHGATTEAARWLAAADHYAELDEVALNKLQDRSLQLRSVLIDLAQTTTIRDSLRLGSHLLDALDKLAPLHFKRVQQAPFVVLKSPDIPSVLIETGFITNPKEERKLQNSYYQTQLIQALYNGIEQYLYKSVAHK